MIDENEAQRAVDYIRDKAPEYAAAKANRTYIENALKTVKAKQMSESDKKTLGDREMDAYMSIEYETMLRGLREAVEIEETLKFRMKAAELRFEQWRVEQFTVKREEKMFS